MVSHHFGHDDTIALDVPSVLPQTLGGRVDVQGDPTKLLREFVANQVEVRPVPTTMRHGKQDFDEIGHAPKTVRATGRFRFMHDYMLDQLRPSSCLSSSIRLEASAFEMSSA